MSKLLATRATLKAVLIAASVALAQGQALPLILASILFSLGKFARCQLGRTIPQDAVAILSSEVVIPDFG